VTKAQSSFEAFGYHLDAIKPVHIANGYFLALTGKHYRLEWLNKLAVVTHKRGLTGDYKTSNLRDILANEKKFIRHDMSESELSSLRLQANAIVANDDAVYAAFDDYSAFGNDYTLSSPSFICDLKRKDGYAGFFIFSVLSVTKVGQKINAIAKEEFEREADSLTRLFQPVLEGQETQVEWENRFQDKLGILTNERLCAIAEQMNQTTDGIHCLLTNSRNIESRYSFLRQLVTALGAWLILYLIREASTVVGPMDSAMLFSDFTGNNSKKCRSKSINCFSRHRELIYQSFNFWAETGKISSLEAYQDKKGRIDLKDVERHFQDLAVRVGLAQPRTATVRAKHYEPQSDTIRTFVLSLLRPDEGPIIFQDFSARLRSTWGIVFGGCEDDVALLAEQGIIGLDEDDDLSVNRRFFINILKSLGLAFEPSDGLVLCELNEESVR
jgi:hypothetical protein